MKVFINAGHDVNLDAGAVNPVYGTRECDIAKKAGEMLAQYLTDACCEVRTLQDDDLGYVCRDANAWGADVFVSLHCNASPSTEGQGFETWYKSFNGQRLAGFIQSQLTRSMGNMRDRGAKQTNGLYVLNCTDAPAVLVEMGFIDNAHDHAILTDDEQLDKIVRAIARGITDYC